MVFGRSETYIKLEIIRRVMMLVVLALSIIFFDVLVAIAIGYIVSSFLDSIITTIFKVEGSFYCFNMIKGLLKKKKV